MCARFRSLVCTTALAAIAGPAALAAPEGPDLPVRVAAIDLPGVKGRIDHLALDAKAKRLYVAALADGTVQVVDLEHGRRDLVLPCPGGEPQGVVLVPARDQLVVTDGTKGVLRIYGPPTPRAPAPREETVPVGDDADNIRLDAKGERLYVGCRSGAIAVVEVGTWKRLAEIPLKGHPESFQLEAKGPRIFVNVPAVREVAVLDREKGEQVGRFPLDAAANYPMALDEARHRLLVACRAPALLVVLDTETGRRVQPALACPGDADDIWIDEARGRVYVTGGEGVVEVYATTDDGLRSLGRVPTAPGARTSLFDPADGRLYVAAPARGGAPARILVLGTR